jgi:hypothetical protein
MRRTGATPWIAAWLMLAGLFATGCAEDEPKSTSNEDPYLQVRVNSSCDQNLLPVTTPDELQTQSMERAQVVVIGGDPTRPSGELASGTQVFLYVGGEGNGAGKPGGDGGSFVSTLGGDSLVGEPMTPDMVYSTPSLDDEFFCTKAGTFYLFAGVKKYEPTGQAIIMPATQGFPVRCIDHVKWQCDCRQICGPQDAVVPDAIVVDAVLPDAALPDANLTDAIIDAVVDSEPPPSVWRMDFFAPTDGAEFQLQVRGAAMAGAKTDVLLQYKITQNGEPRPGIRVDFEKVQPAIGDVRVNPLFGVTNEEGIVSTLVQAGDTPGQVRVLATATLPADGEERPETIDEQSPSISISSGLPSFTNFAFGCVHAVLTGFTHRVYDPDTTPPDGDRWFVGIHDGTECPFALADRLGNRIPAGTPVRFMTEAGSVNDVVRVDPNGRGTTALLVTAPHPKDVEPFDWELGYGLVNSKGPIRHNPRDGLVRIVASTRGEEGFRDVDGDHQYTDGLDVFGPGDDLGEPFVDVDDNNTWDEGEEFDDVDSDGQYTPANSGWDANTVIWRSTLVLWNGGFDGDISTFGPESCDPAVDRFCWLAGPDSPCANSGADFNLLAGRGVPFNLNARDNNSNCLASRDLGSITVTATSDRPGYGAPLWAESQSNAVTIPMDYGYCFDPMQFVPERPMSSPLHATVRFAPPEQADEDAPRAVGGLLKFDVVHEDGLAELVTTTFFATYCLDLTPAL